MFTEEEIAAAKNVKKEILKPEAPEELKSLYMSGEICMWDELQAKNLPQAAVSGSLPPAEITDDAMTIDLHEWVKKIIEGPTGFKVWEDREWVIHHVSREVSIASFVMRCLANKECEGSEQALNAILRRRGGNDR